MTTIRERRLRGEDGAFIVEAAFIGPVFIVLLFALLEYGLIYRDYLTVSDSTQSAAKVGSIQGPRLTTAGYTGDYTIMSDLRQNLANIPVDWIDRIVVFKSGAPGAGGPLAQVPAGCKTAPIGSTGAKCNIYSPKDAFYAVQQGNGAYFSCGSGPACGWSPVTRKNGPKVANIEYLGVYVKLEREMITGVFGNSFNLELASVQRLEPGQLG